MTDDDLDGLRDIEAEIDSYRVMFLEVFPGLSYRDVDDMPFELWDACRRRCDQINESRRGV